MVRALIAEDEPLARRTLRDLAAEVEWLELVGEAEDGKAAVHLINKLEPDLVFLDVQMPELTGLQVLDCIEHRPAVVFTTAFDEYAVTAFELEAIDYLVKPFGRKRFHATLERVRRRMQDPQPEVPAEPVPRGGVRRLFARKGNTIVPVPVPSIVRIDAGESYVKVHTTSERFFLGQSLSELETQLDRERFLRVHRSHIVNLDFVTSIQPYDDRRLAVTLNDGTTVVASRAGSRYLRGLVR